MASISTWQVMLYLLPSSPALQRQAVRTSTGKPVTGTPVALPTRVRSGLLRPLHNFPRFINKDDRLKACNMPLDLGLDPLAVGEPVLNSSERMVLDEKSAEEFFKTPRIGIANTDIRFQKRLSALYREVLGPACNSSNGVLLDLCSSWSSYLPQELQPRQMIGHGMNSEELEANKSLTSSFVQNLNNNTRLPLPAASVSAVLCCNGLQYLTRPEWVMSEVRRVLTPGGLVVVAFSDYCWAERATAGWLARKNGKERMQLVARIMESAGLTVLRLVTKEDGDGDGDGDTAAGSPLLKYGSPAVEGHANGNGDIDDVRGDTMFAVIAQKPPVVAVADGKTAPTVLAVAAAAAAAAAAGNGSGTDGSDMEDGWGEVTMLGADMDPLAVASMYSGPALREMDLWDLDVTPAILERWRLSYTALVDDAKELGIPASAIPSLSSNTTADEIRTARRHLQSMIASFLSAGL